MAALPRTSGSSSKRGGSSAASAAGGASAPKKPKGELGVGRENVSCDFLCGACSGDMDLLKPGEFIRWGRGETRSGDGKLYGNTVNNDWYCERTFMARYQHLYPDRKEFQDMLRSDRDLLNKFLKDRDESVESGKETGKCRFPRTAAGGKQKVSKTEEQQCRLKAPPAKFWHKEAYKRKFLCWPPNKSLGHKRVKFGPCVGAAVPGEEDKDQPWDIENFYQKGVKMEEPQGSHKRWYQSGEAKLGNDIWTHQSS